MTDTRRRVKLYALNAERQWDDKGTGHVSSTYVERLKGISLLVRAESDGTLLLESKIQNDTAYQKQQETLIVWSEGDNFDLALSFQEKAGCDEIWEKICQVQGKDPSVDVTQDMVEESEDERCFDEMSDSVLPIELPPCELVRLEEISELVSSCLSSPMRREKLAVAIESETYINKLLNLFHVCEDLDNIDGLHHLYDIFKNIFFLNKNSLFELMFSEDTIFDVVGCLEFDPNLPSPKKHRQYLRSIATFHKVININNVELLSKIHQTYRVQYIQDVVLPPPSVFEENMLSTLSSFIFFNKVEIVSLVQEDEQFLNEFFNQLMDENTNEYRRKELVLFLKEFCTFSQTLQPQARESFFKTLNSLGILSAMEITLASNDKVTKSASIDVLLHIVEFSASMVREHMQLQHNSTDEESLLMNIIIRQMNCDSDPEMSGAVQLMGIIKTLLDPENMLASVNKSEKTDFLHYFYRNCMRVLIEPLNESTSGDKPTTMMDSSTVQLLSLILELLSFCVEHHTYHIKNYILHKDLLGRILILMSSKHTFLVLCALRFMRKIVALKDEFYNRYIIKGNLFQPVVSAFINNNGRYNLLDSAILEMFEFIKLEDIKSLCTHVVENYSQTLDKITYVQTFKALKLRYDQHQDRIRDRQQSQLESVGSILRPGRYRRDPRQVDEDEEMWFNSDVEIEEEASSSPTQLRNNSAISNEAAALAANAASNNNTSLNHDAVPITQSIVSTSSAQPPDLMIHPPESTNGRLTIEPDASEQESLTHENESLKQVSEVDDDSAATLTSTTQADSSCGTTESISSSPNSSSSTMKKGLVDYDSDEEETDENNEVDSGPAVKRQRTSLNSDSSSD
ncbi:LOW QUALITY PROTEIN: serine/threonine-protein phosphatase 4 regulatory subunit 3 [Lepeophtheirus salmonis]|uniref:LOW QUALITY PROTEIN: serine/threonine-protein phosphatase 4 regulatory subunit 3 n=1 Tax=Lepeophtheirus salmonis TaxID=72036 RepID=UPI001AE51480|nr:LOW QUALITY PROTEIN: serine/threonine-protein phosphatase 4 regulatory subunit 3-like [Lepeophtheirus salmonis]